MQPKPKQWGSAHAAVFQDESVAQAYQYRPPYPIDVYCLLDELATGRPRTILDVGCGSGDLARWLTPIAERVDAVDVSRPMIEIGKTLMGGDARNLHWICSRAETAPLQPPYSLIMAGDSLHWMDWDVIMSRLRAALAPDGYLALVTRSWGTGTPEETAIFSRYSTNPDFRPLNLIVELTARGLFHQSGEQEMAPEPWHPTVVEYIESRHSQSAFSRKRMPPADVVAFDAALRDLLQRLCDEGVITQRHDRLQLAIHAKVTWGIPSSP